MTLAGSKPVTLSSLIPGISSIFCFVDSADTTEELLEALSDAGKNCFMVFVDESKKDSGVDIVSLDGKQILRRQGNRSVVKIHWNGPYGWKADSAKARLSNVEAGNVVRYSPDVSKDGLFMKAVGNPSPAGKVMLISLDDGIKHVVDDDLMVSHGVTVLCLSLKPVK